MIFLLILLLSVMTSCSCEARPRLYCRPRRPVTRIFRNASWKKIAAGGAAVGTVVAAYKISDGAEDGLREAAKEAPRSFTGTVLCFLLIPLAGAIYCVHKLTNRKESK